MAATEKLSRIKKLCFVWLALSSFLALLFLLSTEFTVPGKLTDMDRAGCFNAEAVRSLGFRDGLRSSEFGTYILGSVYMTFWGALGLSVCVAIGILRISAYAEEKPKQPS